MLNFQNCTQEEEFFFIEKIGMMELFCNNSTISPEPHYNTGFGVHGGLSVIKE